MHRVVTQTQLERLDPDASERTLRYRTRRLHTLGLLGRSRPYRERGSAPWHLWPTRRADALVRGEPPPRGGERSEPGPVFLAHAAALTELYVALSTRPPADMVLEGFRREREAREDFHDLAGRGRAIAPDATVCLRDSDGRLLVGFIEIDLGTMSRARLRTKARGYAAYAEREAWTQRHSWCPALLFLTTGSARARAFCDLLAGELPEPSRYAAGERMVGAACAQVTELHAAVTSSGWRDLAGGESLTLLDCLEEARRGYDAERADRRARRAADEQERARLRSDPQALREHLRAQRAPRYLLEERYGETGAFAVSLLLDGERPPSEPERALLDALAGEDPLAARVADGAADATVRAALAVLAKAYRADQQEWVGGLAGRYGEGPHLRKARERLAAGDLLSGGSLADLEHKASGDAQARERQAALRHAYQQRRESEARRLARGRGLSARLRHGVEPFLAEADRLWLRVCGDCEEIAYPEPDEQPDRDGHPRDERRCPFCKTRALAPWTPAARDAGPEGAA